MNTPEFSRMDRRAALKWILTAAATMPLLDRVTFAADGGPPLPPATGYGQDPDLLKVYKPGDVWPLTLTPAQRTTAVALCDTIIPADEKSRAASALGVPDFIDEWISAPYPGHDRDRGVVLQGLAWIDDESERRFKKRYADLEVSERHAICDDIALSASARPEFKTAAQFFARFRDLTAGGFYTTPEGMRDIGYTGNLPTATFEGPSPEVLKKLGLV